jgi:hypothetical protein
VSSSRFIIRVQIRGRENRVVGAHVPLRPFHRKSECLRFIVTLGDYRVLRLAFRGLEVGVAHLGVLLGEEDWEEVGGSAFEGGA